MNVFPSDGSSGKRDVNKLSLQTEKEEKNRNYFLKFKMPAHCAAHGCSNPGVFKFPADKDLLQAWRVALNREGTQKGSLWQRHPFPDCVMRTSDQMIFDFLSFRLPVGSGHY